MTIENETSPAGGDDAALFAEITSADTTAIDSPDEPVLAKAETPAAQIEQPKESNRVPVGELIEERRQRQALERQMQELIAQMRANQPAPPPVQAPDIWENPSEFIDARVSPAMERQQQALMYNARLIAEARFTEQAVRDAQDAFDGQVAAGSLHPADYQKVMSSPNPFAEAVKWYQAHKIVSEIGTDPTAYKAKLRASLLNDPDFRKEAMGAWQGQATSQPQRQSPPISLPSLSKVGATALQSGNDDADDASLWNTVTTARRR
jgi:hypothetical protein